MQIIVVYLFLIIAALGGSATAGAQPSTQAIRIGLLSAGVARLSPTVQAFRDGLQALGQRLLQLAGWQHAGDGLFMARERHLQALRRVGEHLDLAHERLAAQAEHLDLLAEELRLAQQALGEITGEFSADDLLGEIFSRFCIGK